MRAALWMSGLVLGMGLSLGTASRVDAAEAYIGVTGPATGNGVVEIVIEDNTSPAVATTIVTVDVIAGDSPERTAQNIVDRSTDDLPDSYELIRAGTCVTIRGPFISIEVFDDVPGQRIELQEEPCPVIASQSAPSLGRLTLAMLVVAFLALGVTVGRVSRRHARAV